MVPPIQAMNKPRPLNQVKVGILDDSSINAANVYLRQGQKTLALTHIEAAAAHPLLKEKALSLRASIEKLPQ